MEKLHSVALNPPPLHTHTNSESCRNPGSFAAPFSFGFNHRELSFFFLWEPKSVFLLSLIPHWFPLSALGFLISSLQQLSSGRLPSLWLISKGESRGGGFPAEVRAKRQAFLRNSGALYPHIRPEECRVTPSGLYFTSGVWEMLQSVKPKTCGYKRRDSSRGNISEERDWQAGIYLCRPNAREWEENERGGRGRAAHSWPRPLSVSWPRMQKINQSLWLFPSWGAKAGYVYIYIFPWIVFFFFFSSRCSCSWMYRTWAAVSGSLLVSVGSRKAERAAC